MSFSISGSKITQTGTDADLSGLSGVTGVTTTSLGDVTVYDIGDNQLEVQGTVTHDPNNEFLIIGVNAPRNDLFITSTGTYNYGTEFTNTNITTAVKTRGTGLILSQSIDTGVGETQSNSNYAGLYCEGTFNWIGGTIICNSSMFFDTGSTLYVRDGVAICSSSTQGPRIDIGDGNDVDVIGLRYSSLSASGLRGLILQKTTSYTNVQGVRVENAAIGLLANGSNAPDSEPLILRNIPNLEATNKTIWGMYLQTQYKFINYETGNKLADSTLINRWNDANGTGYGWGVKEVGFEITDVAGVAIEGVKIFVRDNDSGNRISNAYRTWWTGLTLPALEGDLTYEWTTDSGGIGATKELTHCIAMGVESALTDGKVADTWISDIRTPAGDAFTAYVHAYAHLPTEITLPMEGNGELVIDWKLFDDLQVTESNEATVGAYTTAETARKAYDLMKLWKLTNLETPTISTLPIGRTGDTLEAGSYDVVIDSAETEVFDFVTNTVRLKTSEFQNSISTTGAVTLEGIAEWQTITGADSLAVTGAIPAAMTLSGSTSGLVLDQAGTYDLSAWTFSGNTADVTVSASTGTVTIKTGGSALVVDDLGNGATVVIDDSVTWSFNVDPAGGTFSMLNLTKWNNFRGVYDTHANAQIAVTSPVSGDYYAVDSDSDGIREEHGYWDGSAWVEEAIVNLRENSVLSSDLGGAGAGASFTVDLPPNTTWRWFYDGLKVTPKVGTINVGTTGGTTTISLNENTSFDGVGSEVYTDILTNYLPLATLAPADGNGTMTGYVPALPAGDIDRALVFVEMMRLSLDSAEGALVTGDPKLVEVTSRTVIAKDDTFRVYPLDTYASGTKCPFAAYIQLQNYTIDFAPVDDNGNYVAYNTTPYALVNGATVAGILPANVYKINDVNVTGINDFKNPTLSLG